jgi:hypothetical protein
MKWFERIVNIDYGDTFPGEGFEFLKSDIQPSPRNTLRKPL